MKHNFIFLLFLFQSVVIISQNDPIKIISWNIKDFGKSKSTIELEKIADIVKDADIVALQEVVSGYGGAQAVAKLSDILNRKGAKWDYIVSDPTKSSKYMSERYAFIWKTSKIKIKNRGRLISELQDEIEREPHMTSFYINSKKFSIINFHAIPHVKNPRPEIEALINYIIAQDNSHTIIAGDFNMNEKDMVFNNLTLSGYQPSLYNQKTTLKQKCENGVYLNYNIDNIYFSKDISKTKSSVIDFVLVCDEIENARKLSDHLPVYLEFKLN
ncbi:endonuclease/exonuclease/phosphatase family protein [Psychroserpens algicola]|uniref:Endonuclease/exonuclease/phosphatase family protein n=1 Tax=Psychroserpens algicola TaxID=1719034 RepID=A0ABT0HAP1_9FLAO|nr:endonuclease/exonuclease/phosphatase family protein [Psychroserpens algicola]MCK8480910.1 endonuclease/exonuclease/phosphatase family protein [Psychroserpens algicola]